MAVNPSDQEELRLLYQITVSDLTYFKTQQWAVAYYAFLMQAGIVGVTQLLGTTVGISDRVLLVILAVAAAAVALFILGKLQHSIEVRQSRLDGVRDQMGHAFKRAWSAHQKQDERVHSIWLLQGGVVVTGLLSCWLVGWRLGVA